ncbi:scp2 sterol transfer family protein [Plasmopara halstedii]|uniref:Scp2 sterol transfer family protein n=1 Tax=Plasmopara halstedii TaxID=4781 RepID=A0A0P1B1Y9_PLAHL|nr:scp2 sterol transfer family protein [Plasmopara halstedii]CEG48016.1 scp2 sterol transfer family protein [Plasmopara halstedii]|eukprot:XP_024584385.1 scp2 sterol transfer family protein [Plasmopara halstedii]
MASRTAELFDMMSAAIDEVGPSLQKKVNGVIKFDIGGAGVWLVDLKNGNGSVKSATASETADVTISLTEENFIKMMNNKLNPQQAFMKGVLKIKGNMGLAMKLNVVLAATRNYMKTNKKSIMPLDDTAPVPTEKSKSKEIFSLLGDVIVKDGVAMSKKVKGIIQFDVTGAGNWNLDLKSPTPALTEGSKQADVTITVSDADFVDIALGKLNAQQAFMKGKLKLKGNMTLAMKLPVVFNAIKPQSKL